MTGNEYLTCGNRKEVNSMSMSSEILEALVALIEEQNAIIEQGFEELREAIENMEV